jgi:hypothetical protein
MYAVDMGGENYYLATFPEIRAFTIGILWGSGCPLASALEVAEQALIDMNNHGTSAAQQWENGPVFHLEKH